MSLIFKTVSLGSLPVRGCEMEGARNLPKVGRFFKELGILSMIVFSFIGVVVVVNAVAPKSSPGTRSAMMSTEEAMFSEGTDPEKARRLDALAIKQANAAPAAAVGEQMDNVGSVEEVEREMRSAAASSHATELTGTWNVGVTTLTLYSDGTAAALGNRGTWKVDAEGKLRIRLEGVYGDYHTFRLVGSNRLDLQGYNQNGHIDGPPLLWTRVGSE